MQYLQNQSVLYSECFDFCMSEIVVATTIKLVKLIRKNPNLGINHKVFELERWLGTKYTWFMFVSQTKKLVTMVTKILKKTGVKPRTYDKLKLAH